MSEVWFTALVLAVGLERVAELIVSSRNAAWSLARGGVESGRGHYPFMVVLHTGLLVAAVAEVWLLDRPFRWWGWVALVVVLLAQLLRWWCISTLGRQWTTRVVVVPGARRVGSGPYRFVAHPNYVAVVAEGAALPLVHSAWMTALAFTVLNAVLLRTRLAAERAALRELV
ncbi:isoprenylcysteine carboxyl methyltransferase family protein [Cumulibacter manganitolerans]|uniref:isoprenylcysteine carboxyl methyltransferase family protein n=1 Tax=Cumulibacter manganitolerans TaxID=1884992 RepID=UPI001296B388|nr:isoprenylcysteine carboxylmethyltransferase family protein [Cumulibacter manganitolerans]